MTLGWRSPWRNRSANPSASLTSVLRALSPLASRAVVRLTASAPARRLKTGRPYTPVLSSATCVHPSWVSQSRSRSQSAVIVEQGRTSFLPGFSTQATRSLACTAIPQQLAYRTSLSRSCRSQRESPHESRVCSAGSQPQLVVPGRLSGQATARLAAPRRLDLLSAVTNKSLSLHCSIFIGGGEAPLHEG